MKLFAFVAFTFLCFSFTHAQNFTEVEQFMLNNQKQLGDDQTLMIYKGGKVIYQKTTGDFKPNIQAPIGESSQWLTAALVLSLIHISEPTRPY